MRLSRFACLQQSSSQLYSFETFAVYLNMAGVKSKYKSKLIDKIRAIDDQDILNEVNRLLEIDVDETVYETSKEQKEEIELAQLQLKSNQGITAEQADLDIDEWLLK